MNADPTFDDFGCFVGKQGCDIVGITTNRIISIRHEPSRIIYIYTKLCVGISLVYDKEWDEASCRNIARHSLVEKSVQLAAFQRQVAIQYLWISDIGHWASMSGKVGATCRPPVASCTSGICR